MSPDHIPACVGAADRGTEMNLPGCPFTAPDLAF